MAKQLYDYWFIQFDFPNEEDKPYKSSGGKMVWNEKLKREIPEGWGVKTIGTFADVKRGSTITKAQTVEGNIKVVAAATDYSFLHNEANRSAYVITVSASGANAGFINFWREPIYASDCSTIQCGDIIETLYCYYWILHFQELLFTQQIGAAQPHVYPEHINKIPIVIPPQQLLDKVGELLVGANMQEGELAREIESLTKQRDELLPLLMNGQVSVNYHLSKSCMRQFVYSYYHSLKNTMKQKFIHSVLQELSKVLDSQQLDFVENTLEHKLHDLDIIEQVTNEELVNQENDELLTAFLSAKKIEGCSAKTIKYYKSTINHLFDEIGKTTAEITTNDIRSYLAYYQEQKQSSKVTIDNMRRIFSSFFSWLEDEDYIVKSPVRRIHKVRTDTLVKEVINDECMELLRDNCTEIRDLAMIDLLASTGMRVGELVQMNIDDVDFQERQCKVFGKGNKEREVYFNARAKIHLQQYISQREDNNPALFVSFSSPHKRLSISGVEVRLRTLGRRINLPKIHPHKFRRTLATMAIDKGMPIEQVQRLLGHVKIDTTLHYAMVNQNNVKLAHRRYIG